VLPLPPASTVLVLVPVRSVPVLVGALTMGVHSPPGWTVWTPTGSYLLLHTALQASHNNSTSTGTSSEQLLSAPKLKAQV
jgi:hypothetical protein